jgi:hypothetical protein
MAKIISGKTKVDSTKSKRPNIHAKTKTSKSVNATNYKKSYRGQGR